MSAPVEPDADEVLGTSRPLAWWGALVTLGAATTMITTMAFAHVYLGAVDDLRPDLVAPGVALLVLLASSAAMALARASARARRRAPAAVPGLALAGVLGAAFLALQGWSYGRMALDIRADVADASFAVTVAFHHALAGVGLVGLAVAALKRAQLPASARSRDAVLVAGLVWQTVVLAWVPLFLLLYVLPRLV